MVINIHDSGQVIKLRVGIYSIRVLGGWGVKVGDFSFLLKNVSNNNITKPNLSMMRIQSFEYGQRAKKIMTVDISESGDYQIEFKNQKDLMVRNSNLFLSRLFFEKEIPNSSIKICFN